MVSGLVIVIHSGDTLNSISQELGSGFTFSVADLESMNNVDPNNLQVGKFLMITQEQGLTVLVRAGDTAFRIASAAGITTADLQGRNPGLNFDNLQIGSEVTIFSRGP
jgi:LysM repeat protein